MAREKPPWNPCGNLRGRGHRGHRGHAPRRGERRGRRRVGVVGGVAEVVLGRKKRAPWQNPWEKCGKITEKPMFFMENSNFWWVTAGNRWKHLLSMEVDSWENHSKNQQDDGFIPKTKVLVDTDLYGK